MEAVGCCCCRCPSFLTIRFIVSYRAFLNGLLWTVAEGIITDAKDVQGRGGEPGWFTFQLASFVFFPLQGFFNFVIFIRPVYIKRRKNYPTESISSALWGIIILGQGSTSLILKKQQRQPSKNRRRHQQNDNNNTSQRITSSGDAGGNNNSSMLRRNLRGFFRFNTGSRRDSLATTNGGAAASRDAEIGSSSSSPTKHNSKNNVKLSGGDDDNHIISNNNGVNNNEEPDFDDVGNKMDLDPGLSFTVDDDILFSLNVLTTTTTIHHQQQQPIPIDEEEAVCNDDDDNRLMEEHEPEPTIHDDTEATDNVPHQLTER